MDRHAQRLPCSSRRLTGHLGLSARSPGAGGGRAGLTASTASTAACRERLRCHGPEPDPRLRPSMYPAEFSTTRKTICAWSIVLVESGNWKCLGPSVSMLNVPHLPPEILMEVRGLTGLGSETSQWPQRGPWNPCFYRGGTWGQRGFWGQSLAMANWPAGRAQALSLSQGPEGHSAVPPPGQPSEPS